MAGSLSAFFAQNVKKIDTEQFAVSERFVDPETGEAVLWEIGCITAAENAQLRRDSMQSRPVPGKRGQFTQELDANAYLAQLCARCVLFPNLHDPELLHSYGVLDAAELLGTMLSPGEFETLSARVLALNGFPDAQELVEEAKN